MRSNSSTFAIYTIHASVVLRYNTISYCYGLFASNKSYIAAGCQAMRTAMERNSTCCLNPKMSGNSIGSIVHIELYNQSIILYTSTKSINKCSRKCMLI